MSIDGLSGRGLLQSQDEWTIRNRVLASSLSELVVGHIQVTTGRGLDVGCQTGILTDMLTDQTDLTWQGIDPMIEKPTLSPNGAELLHGWAHELPFPDAHFDCVVLANVYEHIPPQLHAASLAEIQRVLTKVGILVGQLPNPHFPIELHSRLPFMGWLPYRMQQLYFRLSPVPWEHNFYVVTVHDLRQTARAVGFSTARIRRFSYPPEAVPNHVRWVADLLERPMRIVPLAWQFVFSRM